MLIIPLLLNSSLKILADFPAKIILNTGQRPSYTHSDIILSNATPSWKIVNVFVTCTEKMEADFAAGLTRI